MVWVVAGIGSLQAFYRSLEGVLDGKLHHFLLWTFAAISLFVLGAWHEKVKSLGGD